MAVLAAVAVPYSLATVDRSRAWAATRYLSARMALARAQAVKRSTYVTIRFDSDSSGILFGTFVNGNRNGVLTRDIASGADRALEPPVQLLPQTPHVNSPAHIDRP